MMLHEKAFNNAFMHGVFLVGWALKYPQFWFINKMLSYMRETTAEREDRIHNGPCYERGCILMFLFGMLFIILL